MWRLPPKTPVGTWPEYRLGWVHVQEEVTVWPADLLGAQPGERILDLCAAPGNKTARLAANMGNRGFLHANEKRWQRASALRFNLDRLGVTCAGVTIGDGRELALGGPPFDRALLDVPCSGEGMVRKTKGFIRPTSPQEREGMVGTQKGLLRAATEAVRPGGTLVYATCTFAPEENENVVDWGVRNLPLECVELEAPQGWSPQPGLLEWQGRAFDPSIAKCGRFWPHIHDSGGSSLRSCGKFEVLEPVQSRQLETYLEERFGMRTEVLSNYRWVKRAESASIWLVGKESNWEPEREWETLGIPAFRKAP